MEILRPLAASDPLVPDLCEMMADLMSGMCPSPQIELGAEFAELAHKACRLRPGTSPRRTAQARALVKSLREIMDQSN